MKIEKNIPIKGRKENYVLDLIKQMEVGDSVLNPKRVCASFTQMVNRHKIDYKFTERAVDGGFRIWRTK